MSARGLPSSVVENWRDVGWSFTAFQDRSVNCQVEIVVSLLTSNQWLIDVAYTTSWFSFAKRTDELKQVTACLAKVLTQLPGISDIRWHVNTPGWLGQGSREPPLDLT